MELAVGERQSILCTGPDSTRQSGQEREARSVPRCRCYVRISACLSVRCKLTRRVWSRSVRICRAAPPVAEPLSTLSATVYH
jgi:hypothetical protein